MPPKPKKTTRDHLIQVAERLFSQRGFHAVSIRDMAAAAKTNVASVNYHFGDKYGLYEAVLVSHFESINKRVVEEGFFHKAPKEQLRIQCRLMQEMVQKKENFFRMGFNIMISEKDLKLKKLTRAVLENHIKPLVERLQFNSRRCSWKNGPKGLSSDSFVFLIMAVNYYWKLFVKDLVPLFGKSPAKLTEEAFDSLNRLLEHYIDDSQSI